jgi:hypothetical protein
VNRDDEGRDERRRPAGAAPGQQPRERDGERRHQCLRNQHRLEEAAEELVEAGEEQRVHRHRRGFRKEAAADQQAREPVYRVSSPSRRGGMSNSRCELAYA